MKCSSMPEAIVRLICHFPLTFKLLQQIKTSKTELCFIKKISFQKNCKDKFNLKWNWEKCLTHHTLRSLNKCNRLFVCVPQISVCKCGVNWGIYRGKVGTFSAVLSMVLKYVTNEVWVKKTFIIIKWDLLMNTPI